jgi:cardiolipin synthase
MISLIDAYWPHILFIVSVVAGASAAVHATMT